MRLSGFELTEKYQRNLNLLEKKSKSKSSRETFTFQNVLHNLSAARRCTIGSYFTVDWPWNGVNLFQCFISPRKACIFVQCPLNRSHVLHVHEN